LTQDTLSRLRQIKANLERRAIIIDNIRAFFVADGFLEVETPLLMPVIVPERYISPFTSDGWFLATSPELYMKQLLAAGYSNIFQICHCFRKGERGQRHQPEFTMLEWYRSNADYLQIIQDTERLVFTIAQKLRLTPAIRYQGNQIDLTPPWPRVTVRDAFLRTAARDPVTHPDRERFDIDLVDKVIPGFAPDRPTVLLDYPATECSLSRLKPGDPLVAERAEVFIGGLEIANAYSELTDAVEQEARFRLEMEYLVRESKHDFTMPRDLLAAIAQLPPCGGIALGIDRLVMLFCDAPSIDDVTAFPKSSV